MTSFINVEVTCVPNEVTGHAYDNTNCLEKKENTHYQE